MRGETLWEKRQVSETAESLPVDQRGKPRILGANVDIGAGKKKLKADLRKRSRTIERLQYDIFHLASNFQVSIYSNIH